jgi:hypothetical protein
MNFIHGLRDIGPLIDLVLLGRWKPSRRSKPYAGGLRLADHSSLRKLMRAAARDMVPDERMVIIDAAIEKAMPLRVTRAA